MEKVAVITLLLSYFVAVPSWAEASENVYKFACGNKTLSLYESSKAMFVDKTKADALEIRSVTNGAVVNFRLYAEMGGSYTQYQMSIFDVNTKLNSQWLTADGDPRRAADVTNCSIMNPAKGNNASNEINTGEDTRRGAGLRSF